MNLAQIIWEEYFIVKEADLGSISSMYSFYACSSQRRKKIDDFTVSFTLLGSARVKAVRRTLMKLTPGDDFINIIYTAFTPINPKSIKRYWQLDWILMLLGSTISKAARRMLMKLTPGYFLVRLCLIMLNFNSCYATFCEKSIRVQILKPFENWCHRLNGLLVTRKETRINHQWRKGYQRFCSYCKNQHLRPAYTFDIIITTVKSVYMTTHGTPKKWPLLTGGRCRQVVAIRRWSLAHVCQTLFDCTPKCSAYGAFCWLGYLW